MEKKTMALLGAGKIASIVANAWKNGLLSDYELVYIAGRDGEKAKKLAEETGAADGGTAEGIFRLKPDYVVEAASIESIRMYGEKILKMGSSLVLISIGVLADPVYRAMMEKTAAENRVQIIVSNGVTGGFDVLRTFRLMGDVRARFITRKGPDSLKGTLLYDPMLQEEETVVFDGTAADIIQILPTKVNVAVAASLAAAEPETTRTTMISVPEMVGDDHRMIVEVDGNKALIDVYTKSGSSAGFGLVATLQNLHAPIVFA